MRSPSLFVVLLALGCTGTTEPPRERGDSDGASAQAGTSAPVAVVSPEGEEAAELSRDCTGESFTVGQGSNVLDEARGAGVKAPDFFESYAAVAIDPASATPMKVTGSHVVDGRALLWIAGDAVVVDASVFPVGLTVAEVTSMRAGERKVIGKIEPDALEELGLGSLAEFLLHARVVGTWIHIGAELCLVDGPRSEAHGGQLVSYAGTHTYFTNEENEDAVAFTLRVAKDGTLEVEARSPAR